MPDFTRYLRQVAGNAVKAPALPQELYPGIVRSFEFGDQNRNKTPYARLHLALTGWPDSIPESARSYPDKDGNPIPMDLSKKRMRRDFYLTDDAYYLLDDMYRSCGIEPDGRGDAELVPQLVGCQVTVEVQQYLNQTTNEIGNQVGRVFGPNNVS